MSPQCALVAMKANSILECTALLCSGSSSGLLSSRQEGNCWREPAGGHRDGGSLEHLPYREKQGDLALFSVEKIEKGHYKHL